MARVPLLPDRPRPLLFAHRGCSSLAPENTLPAFRLAREKGAPGLELDVHRCASGELVVIHDDLLARTAGDGRRVAETPLNELRRLDAGSWYGPAFAGTPVPLLEEVLEEFLPDTYIDIEMKTRSSSADDPLPGSLAELLRRFGKRAEGAVAVSSFNPLALRGFKRRNAGVPTAVIWCADGELPAYLRRGQGRWISGCDYLKPIHTKAGPLSRFFLSRLGSRPLVAWTVDDAEAARKLTAAGCAGIITNRPQDLVPALCPDPAKGGVR